MDGEPFDESTWSKLGIPVEEARHWWAHGFRPDVAAPWWEAGISPKMAEYFIRHDRPLDEVARELEDHKDEMQPFHDFGDRVHAEGEATAEVINSYFQDRWLDDQASSWAVHNVSAPHARVWIEFGIAPADAARLIAQGDTLASTIRTWWDAGIPSSEMADWIASGCSPTEAADRRTGRMDT